MCPCEPPAWRSRWYGCKGTRASVASSAGSLSLIQLAAILVDSFPMGRSMGPHSDCFHCCWRETLIPPLCIHTNSLLPPSLLSLLFIPVSSTLPCFHLGVHSALLLYDSLVTIVCVSMPAERKGCTALFLFTLHVMITVLAQHIASDVNSWPTNL